MTQTAHHRPTLVLGGTGRTGRLVERLTRRRIPVRIGSRSAGLPFDWEQPSTWRPGFQDAEAAYTYVPDLAVSNPTDAIAGVVETALAAGTRRPVVLSGRGEEKAGACEAADGVERVLERPARDFADYARATAATGAWAPTDQPNPGDPR